MSLPGDNILSWRFKECEITNDEISASELNQSDETVQKEQCANVNLPESISVQELTSLFSRLSLHGGVTNVENDTNDERNHISIGFKEPREQQQENIRSSWHFSNIQEQFTKNQDFSNYFGLHFEPLFCTYLQGCYGSENCNLLSRQTVTDLCRSSFATNRTFVNPFSLFYIRRSSFSSFLVNFLTRACRMKANIEGYGKSNGWIYDAGLSKREESTAEVRRKDSQGLLLVRRVPSQKQETYAEELITYTNGEHLSAVVEGIDPFVAQCWTDIKHGTFDEVNGILFSNRGNEELKQDILPLEDGQCSDVEMTLVESPEEARLISEHEMHFEEEPTLVGELECLTSEQNIFLEQETTLIAQEIHSGEEVISFENLDQYTSVADGENYWKELTLVQEQDCFIEERALTNDQEYTALGCYEANNYLPAEFDARMEGFNVEESGGRKTHFEDHKMCLEDQETCPEGQETNPKRQDFYIVRKETRVSKSLRGQETDLEYRGSNFARGIYLRGKEIYFEGLGEESFRTVGNASPRARELLEKSRNLR